MTPIPAIQFTAPSRRAVVLGCASLLALPAAGHAATRSYDNPPLLMTPRHQFVIMYPPLAVPTVRLHRIDGRSVDLSMPRGKVVLLNFWASWCPQCRKELPLLDRLQIEMAGSPFQVIAIATDKQGLRTVVPFVKQLGLEHIAVYLDPQARLWHPDDQPDSAAGLPLHGIPVSYVIDREGYAVGSIEGAVDWSSQEARNFLGYYLQ